MWLLKWVVLNPFPDRFNIMLAKVLYIYIYIYVLNSNIKGDYILCIQGHIERLLQTAGQSLTENKLHLNLKCSSTLITVMLLYLYMAAQTLTRGHSITNHTSLLLMHNSKSNTEEKSGLHDLQPQGTRSRKKQRCLSFIFEKKKTKQKTTHSIIICEVWIMKPIEKTNPPP